MNTPSRSPFKYNFRAPGSQVEGPIQFDFSQSAMGKILIGRSQGGICAVFLGEEEHGLRDQLPAEFPNIELQADQASLKHELDLVMGFTDKQMFAGVINLDIGGTVFQQKVWQALCDIPAGKTCSYSDVARGLGAPEAVRAVAGACAANVLAIAIPCHRVVRRDGSISGYRWGIERKRSLLKEEASKRGLEFSE